MLLVIGDPKTGGFNGGVKLGISNNDLAVNESPEMWNFLVDESGLVKMPGSWKDNEEEIVVDTPITGLYRFFDGTVFKTFAKCGTKVVEVKTTGAHTDIATGLTAATEIQFESWFSRYFFVDGSDLWSGTTGAASKVTIKDEKGNTREDGNLPKGLSIALHNQRLWITRNASYPTYVYFSEMDFYDRWKVNGWVACDRDDGQPITGMIEYNGKIIIWKKFKMFFIQGDPAMGNLSVTRGPNCGAYDQKSIVNCPDGFVRWYGPDGIWEYSDSTGVQRISRNIDSELKNILDNNRPKACAGAWDRYYVFFYPHRTAATFNDRGFAYDTWLKIWMPIKGWNISCLCRFEDNTLHGGCADSGFVKKLFYGTTNDGAETECYWESKFFLFPGMIYALNKIRASVKEGHSLRIAWQSDYGSNVSGTYEVYQPIMGGILADENDDPADTDFWVGDAQEGGDGNDMLLSEDDEGAFQAEFHDRIKPGQNFREIKFSFWNKSIEELQLDYVEVTLDPVREL